MDLITPVNFYQFGSLYRNTSLQITFLYLQDTVFEMYFYSFDSLSRPTTVPISSSVNPYNLYTLTHQSHHLLDQSNPI